jgi:3-hydroxybutyryl-CoA dehydratase
MEATVLTRAFESFQVGQEASLTRTITAEEIEAFCALSGDINPLHRDDAFAMRRGFKSRVAHGALLNAYVSQVIGTQLPGLDCLLQSLNMRYVKPVYGGMAIVTNVRIAHISEAVRSLVLEVEIVDRDCGEIVAKGKAQAGLTQESAS